ncbi:Piso0_001825 [Millerozyma farinosa CBS 7064]|uniref:Piso0_001825 protein n=1 Tax=Pichia sorbitophila (strain ATCC MYA-4447 / BCRC 22081 / CBS 7064 / NBRC 10061 / NRRL Y-12695) TaxID=559304 RepID=G8YLU3_PICSO|nr:Piso0_001825 [Millerozyma farinosa CBS 7064]
MTSERSIDRMEEISNDIKAGLGGGRLLREEENTDNGGRTTTGENTTTGHQLPSDGHGLTDIDAADISTHYIQASFDKINEAIGKIEGEKIVSINQELSYVRQILDYQNNKIEKLTSILADILENKNQNAIITSLQTMQDQESVHVGGGGHGDRPQGQDSMGMSAQVQDSIGHQDADSLNNSSVPLDSNMDPQLHQVAAAAVQQAEEHAAHHSTHPELDKYRKKIYLKRKSGDEHNAPVGESAAVRAAKRPKIQINFLHNPMTVKEIYDEFTKGFRGQPPLCEMDARFGKHEWRGDSRSKESKRYQRRKKLCDAISKGMQKYDKSADEIIRYIEEFRGDKSLTWIMNGNLPPDLLN